MTVLTPRAAAGVAPAAARRRRGLSRWIAARPLLSVVLLTHALTWVVLVSIALDSHG